MRKIESYIAFAPVSDTEIDINIKGIIGFDELMQEGDDITTTKEKLNDEIRAFSEVDKRVTRININIDSAGGSVNHALSMYHALSTHPAEKFVTYTGNSASAATVLGAVAKRENVRIAEYFTLLIHEARATKMFAVETAGNMRAQIKELDIINENLAKIYSNVNGQTVQDNLALMAQDSGEGIVLTAHEAKELGFVGQVDELQIKAAAVNKDELKAAGWTNKNIKQLTNKTIMFDFLNKKAIQKETTEQGTYLFSELAEGEKINLQDSNEEINGTVEIRGKSVDVAAGVIKGITDTGTLSELEEIKAAITALSAGLEALKEVQAQAKPADNTEIVNGVENINTRLEAMESIMLSAKLSKSTPTPPEQEFDGEEIKAEKPNIHEQIRAKQAELNKK